MTTLDDARVIQLRTFESPNGRLVPIENGPSFPFEIRRVFHISEVETDGVRGQHAHFRCQQALVCLRGKCEVVLDDGNDKKSVELRRASDCLIIPPLIWAEQRYENPDTALLVLADLPFDESDYIRDYATFVRLRAGK